MNIHGRAKWLAGIGLFALIMGVWGVKPMTSFRSPSPLESLPAEYSRNLLKLDNRQAEYNLRLTDGSIHSTVSDRGRVVLLFFWATWAHPCYAMSEQLNFLLKKYLHAPVTIIGLPMDMENEAVVTYCEQVKTSIPQARLPVERIAELGQIRGVPTLILLSPTGAIYRKFEGQMDAAEIEKHLIQVLHNQ